MLAFPFMVIAGSDVFPSGRVQSGNVNDLLPHRRRCSSRSRHFTSTSRKGTRAAFATATQASRVNLIGLTESATTKGHLHPTSLRETYICTSLMCVAMYHLTPKLSLTGATASGGIIAMSFTQVIVNERLIRDRRSLEVAAFN